MPAPHANVAWDIRHLQSVPSTNTVVMDAARAGAPEGLVVVAEHQSEGRGRLGRAWTAPPGASLLVSLLVRPHPSADGRAHLLTAALALAAADACSAVAGFRPGLKWPNDLVVETPDGWRKLAGILAERDPPAVVLGLGLNVNWPTPLPDELVDIVVAANHLAGRDVDCDSLLSCVLDEFGERYRLLAHPSAWREVATEYRSRCVTVGQPVLVDVGGSILRGQAVALSEQGHLGVQSDEGLTWVAAGDVTHVRPA